RFYETNLQFIFSKKNTIEEIFRKKSFTESNDFNVFENQWRVIINTSHRDFSKDVSEQILNYCFSTIYNYPVLSFSQSELFNMRNRMIIYGINLLDKIGWEDEYDSYTNNYDYNVIKIADKIIADKIFDSEKLETELLNKIYIKDHKILGFYTLLNFRLSCCSDRGGSNHNLSRALILHNNANAKTDGYTSELVIDEMRELSQLVFKIFKRDYISKNIDFFDEIHALNQSNLLGNFEEFFISDKNEKEVKEKISNRKYEIISYIIYQLSSSIINQGIGCGYYNESGTETPNNNEGIKDLMNSYLFDVCFNPEINDSKYLNFLDYLIVSIQNQYLAEEYNPQIFTKEITKTLKFDKLQEYWNSNKDQIKKLVEKNRVVMNSNYNEVIIKLSDCLEKALNCED
ncbi:MAG: hypothetical protein GY756_19500, partial [bacterium]|nr:hypothetical protein [bacterium]